MVFPKWKWELIWLVLGHGSLQLVTRSLQVSSQAQMPGHTRAAVHIWPKRSICGGLPPSRIPASPTLFTHQTKHFNQYKGSERACGAPPDTLFFMPCGGVLSFHLLYKCVHHGVLYFYTSSVFYALGLPSTWTTCTFHLWFCFWYYIYIFQQAQVFALQCLLFLQYEFWHISWPN